MFVTWEGRPRPFEAVFASTSSLPDLRVLAGIAEELDRPLGFRTVAEARAQMEEMGPWDGERATHGGFETGLRPSSTTGDYALATWKLLVDNGSMQDGDKHYRATGRAPVARMSRSTYDALRDGSSLASSAEVRPTVTLTGDRGSVTLPAQVADLADDVVWVPANSFGNGVLADLASPGSRVTVTKGADQ